MLLKSYDELPPLAQEDAVAYCRRMEADGHGELQLRMAVRLYYNLDLASLGAFFEEFPEARLRYVAMLVERSPTRSTYSLQIYVSRQLGVSSERAAEWIAQYHDRAGAPKAPPTPAE